MAEKLDSYDFRRSHPRKPSLPWDLWLDGHIWKLSSKDLDGRKFASVRNRAGVEAKRRGLRARSSLKDGYLIIQAYKPSEDATKGDIA